MSFAARIVLDSIAPSGGRLTTFEVTFPRIVLAEFNTHRMFSRNSASSRAVPVPKRIEAIEADPFVPEQFGKNQRGMQAGVALLDREDEAARFEWNEARLHAVVHARNMAHVGVHKQLANRLLEPFAWHTAVVTATHWGNFFGLRDSEYAQPEIAKAARMMRGLYEASTPREVPAWGWHLPYVEGVDADEFVEADFTELELAKISTARCARVSYLTQNGVRDPKEDLALYDRLVGPGHLSPLEHVAQSLTTDEWMVYARLVTDRWVHSGLPVGNFWGWRQFRKTILHEDDFSARPKEAR